jgi:hypothetical protein
MTVYRDPIPENRTVIPGVWSDLMDLFLSAMELSNRNNSGLGVFIQDQTTRPFSLPFVTNRVQFTLAVDAVVNSRTLTAVAGHGIIAGNLIELNQNNYFLVAKVLSVATNVVTLDQPVNYPYTTTSQTHRSSDNLLVDGSVTPVIFSIKPYQTQVGDVTRMTMEFIATTPMDFLRFGGANSLVNGVVVRVNKGDGTYSNLFNIKTNGEIVEQAYEHSFLIPRTGATDYGFAARVTWAGNQNHGVVIRLDGSLNESLEAVVQDDLTVGNIKFQMRVQGSEIQE